MPTPHPHRKHVVVVAGAACLTLLPNAFAAPDEARARRDLARAQSSAESLRSKLAGASAQVEQRQASIAGLDTQLARLEPELAQARRRASRLNRQLSAREAELSATEAELRAARRQLSNRMVAIYTTGGSSTISALAGAGSWSEALGRHEAAQHVVSGDQKLIRRVGALERQLKRDRSTLARLHAEAELNARELERATTELRSAKAQMAQEQRRLTQAVQARSAQLDGTEARIALLEENLAALASASPELERTITSAPVVAPPVEPVPPPVPQEGEKQPAPAAGAAPPQNAGPATQPTPAAPATPAPAGYVWPVGGPVISPYGMRNGTMHSGIDIAAPSGTPVVATASGTVIFAGWMNGYGNLVVVQHTGGVSSAYAHLSRIASGQGQSVGRGQLIGNVGCTGRCYGDHLHFETRLNGAAVNPLTYL